MSFLDSVNASFNAGQKAHSKAIRFMEKSAEREAAERKNHEKGNISVEPEKEEDVK